MDNNHRHTYLLDEKAGYYSCECGAEVGSLPEGSDNQKLLQELGFTWDAKIKMWQAPKPSFLGYTQHDVDTINPDSFYKALSKYFKQLQ